MLDLMRKHARSWLIKVALGGVIIVFIFWYGWSGPGEQSSTYLAKVDGTIITTQEYREVYDSEVERLRQRFRGGIPSDLLEKMELKKSIAQNLINQALLIHEAKRLGISVTDEELVDDIRSTPLFQRNGVFDDGMYRSQLRTIKFTPQTYEVYRRKQLLAQQMAQLLTDSVKTNPEEIKQLWHFQNDNLVLSMLLIRPETPAEQQAADPKEIEAFFTEHQSKYEVPPSVDLQYVDLSWRDLKDKLSVSEDEARDYYQMNPREFTIPESYRIQNILLKIPPDADKEKLDEIRKKAEELLARIKGGEDFAQVAQQASEDTASAVKGGDLGFVAKGTMSRPIEMAVQNLAVGDVTGPVLSEQGYNLIKLEDKKPESAISFDEAKQRILDKLLEDRARKKIAADADEFYEQVYRTENLEKACQKFGFELKSAKGVTRAAGIPGLGNDPKIMNEAFDLKNGEVSRLIKSGDNFIVLKVVGITRARVPGLDEVRTEVEKDYRKDQAQRKTVKKAQEIIAELQKSPGEADEIAKKFGVTWEQLDPISRTAGFTPKLGRSDEVQEMLATVSVASPIYPKPLQVTDGVAVVRLTDVQVAGEERYAKEGPALERWIGEVRRKEFLEGWLRILQQKSQVQLNEKLL
ncbi:MAG: SurA N-terminal domain-containing protein [Desulfomonile tiedjei]|nr:SurA N-terminal domain-containing protein [Desulfomonile tiedjei]